MIQKNILKLGCTLLSIIAIGCQSSSNKEATNNKLSSTGALEMAGESSTNPLQFYASANPIILASGVSAGQTTLNWNAPNATKVEIHVNSPGGQLFAGGISSGSAQTGPWISNGMVFYLQDASNGNSISPSNTLSTVTVYLDEAGTLFTASANPIPVQAGSSLGQTTLNWSAPSEVKNIEIHVSSPNGTLFAEGINIGSATTGLWVSEGLTFYLQDATNGDSQNPENTLAVITSHLQQQAALAFVTGSQQSCNGPNCVFNISWQGLTNSSIVTVAQPGGGSPSLMACSATTGSQSVNWIPNYGSGSLFKIFSSTNCSKDVGLNTQPSAEALIKGNCAPLACQVPPVFCDYADNAPLDANGCATSCGSLVCTTTPPPVITPIQTPPTFAYQTFSAGTYSFTVPANVNSLTVQVWGGAGGFGFDCGGEKRYGGIGEYSTQIVPVQPGSIYHLNVQSGRSQNNNANGGAAAIYNPDGSTLVHASGGSGSTNCSTNTDTGESQTGDSGANGWAQISWDVNANSSTTHGQMNFDDAGVNSTWSVPAGVTDLSALAVGGGGQNHFQAAHFAVTPGQVFEYYVQPRGDNGDVAFYLNGVQILGATGDKGEGGHLSVAW